MFEFLTLESAQAGLSWITILRKRENYRRAFAYFDVERVAAFTDADVERLLATDSGIIRNRLKVKAAITNARAFVEAQREFGSFCDYLRSFLPGGVPVRHLYDLEKMMDTDFARSALANAELYQTVVAHRRKFNSIPGIDYDTHRPAFILICPPENLMASWKDDYERLRQSFIYETDPKTFDELSAC